MDKNSVSVSTNKDLVITKNPKSRFAEAIKTIRTNLAFSNIDKDNKLILVTSCEPGDGKSFVSANLAVAYSQEGKKVLIVDCDMRKGRQHNIFGVPNSVKGGYSNLILNYLDFDYKQAKREARKEIISDFSIEDYIIKTNIKNVSLIPSGPIPPNPTELLSSNNNQLILEKLKNMYDIVILDCPPVIGISDTSIMTKYSDVNLLVISCKKTKIELVNRVKRIFQNVNAEITGVILNKVSVKDSRYGGYYSSSYYGEDK